MVVPVMVAVATVAITMVPTIVVVVVAIAIAMVATIVVVVVTVAIAMVATIVIVAVTVVAVILALALALALVVLSQSSSGSGSGSGGTPPAPQAETRFVSIVTAPLMAQQAPGHADAGRRGDARLARMFPANMVPVPSVAELPTCQKTFAPRHVVAGEVTTIDELLAVVSVLPILKTHGPAPVQDQRSRQLGRRRKTVDPGWEDHPTQILARQDRVARHGFEPGVRHEGIRMGLRGDQVTRVYRSSHDSWRKASDRGSRADAHVTGDDGQACVGDRRRAEDAKVARGAERRLSGRRGRREDGHGEENEHGARSDASQGRTAICHRESLRASHGRRCTGRNTSTVSIVLGRASRADSTGAIWREIERLILQNGRSPATNKTTQ